MRGRSTRRELFAASLVPAAALVALPDAALADPVPSDSEELSKVLAVERLMVLAYQRVLGSGTLRAFENRQLAEFLRDELAHVDAVSAALKGLGVSSPPSGPLDLKTAQSLLAQHKVPGSLTELHTRHDSLRLLVDLESLAEGAHFTALKTLGSAELVRLSTQMMACEAQHWTVVSGLRNPGQYVKSVPWPFVTGSS